MATHSPARQVRCVVGMATLTLIASGMLAAGLRFVRFDVHIRNAARWGSGVSDLIAIRSAAQRGSGVIVFLVRNAAQWGSGKTSFDQECCPLGLRREALAFRVLLSASYCVLSGSL